MTSQQRFWDWFIQHEIELFDFESNREEIFDQLAAELQKVDPDLAFEFGPKKPRREFVVSAGGIKRAFAAVKSLSERCANSEPMAGNCFSSTALASQ